MADKRGDQAPLLINKDEADLNQNPHGLTAEESTTDEDFLQPGEPTIIVPSRKVIIEPVIFLFCLAIFSNDTLLEQYIRSRLTHLYPILQNNGTTGWNISNCAGSNNSDPLVVAEASVVADTSVWQIYLALPTLITMVTTLIYGAYSDIAGRRQILLLPSIFAAIKFTITSLVIYYNLPLYVLLVASAIEPFGGGFYTLVMGVYAYLADITPPEKLGIRMTIVEVVMTFGTGCSQVGLGYSIRSLGYFYTYIILAGVLFLNLIYVIFFVPETIVQNKNKPKLNIGEHLRSTWLSFSDKEDGRHVKIGLLVTAFLVLNLTIQSYSAIQILFVMGPPLCWGTVGIGIFTGMSIGLMEIASILGYELLTRCKVEEIGIAAIGIVSTLASVLVNAFADSFYWMIVVPLAGIFVVLPSPMLRTCASKLFREDEQGRVLSAFSAVGAFCYAVSALMMNSIYQRTARFMTGFVFLVGAGFCLLSLFVIGCYVVFTRKSRNRQKEVNKSR
ncbi:lysosomal proton-coupled steroid conjugate and bile acid symporter SLC46A3-like [Lineus longissimus]|uniref:lysosomal proton-coupled steroid conjugate and bile acid symporter SLC46A3-like n=1 Tax=Lineus longissimus TaxID=88925 RepID=UPI00315DC47D